MKLVLKRTQSSSMMGRAKFGLTATLNVSAEERGLIQKYGIGGQTVYSSEARQRNAETAMAASQGQVGLLRGFAALAMGALSLNCTVNSLIGGQYIECKDLPELLAAEGAIREAAETVKTYLQVAATFDGREEVIEL